MRPIVVRLALPLLAVPLVAAAAPGWGSSRAPMVKLSLFPTATSVGAPVTVSPSAARFAVDQHVTSWKIDFGDRHSTSSAGQLHPVTHTYARSGTFFVHLWATTTGGKRLTAREVETVTAVRAPAPAVVAPVAPPAALTPALTVEGAWVDNETVAQQGTGVLFSGAWTNVPTGSSVRSASLDFGDGSASRPLSGAPATWVVRHVFARPGSYRPTLTVVDAAGRTTTAAVTETVFAAPSLTVPGIAGAPGSELTLSPTVDLAGAPAKDWKVDWGGGSPVSAGSGDLPATLTHTFDTAATYPVVVTVTTAAHGAVSTVAEAAVSLPAPPVVSDVSTVVAVDGKGAASPLVYELSSDTGVSDESCDCATVALNLTSSKPKAGQRFTSFKIAWGDNSIPKVVYRAPGTQYGNPSHRYTTAGHYTITVDLAVSGPEEVVSTSVDLTVKPAMALAVTVPTAAQAEGPVTLPVALTTPSGVTATGWSATIAYDCPDEACQKPGQTGTSSPAPSFTLAALPPGRYLVTVTALSDANGAASQTFPLVIGGTAPALSLASGSEPALDFLIGLGSTLSLTGTDVPAVGRSAVSHSISWGDGTPEVPMQAETLTWYGFHSYTTPGTYSGSYVVHYDDGTLQTEAFTVTVAAPPALSVTAPSEAVDAHTPITITDTFTVGGAPFSSGSIVWGDQTPSTVVASSGPAAGYSHTYATPGYHQGKMYAVDTLGQRVVAPFTVVVGGAALTARLTDTQSPSTPHQIWGAIGQPLTLYATGSYPVAPASSTASPQVGGQIVSGTISWGDGTPDITLSGTPDTWDLRHAFADQDVYLVTLTVRDAEGTVAQTATPVTVMAGECC